jgi:hypothetical protein
MLFFVCASREIEEIWLMISEIQNQSKVNFDYLEFSEFESGRNKVLISIKWSFVDGKETKIY